MGRIFTRPRTPVAAQLLRPNSKPTGFVVSSPYAAHAKHLIGDWVLNESSGTLVRDASNTLTEYGVLANGEWRFGDVTWPSYSAANTLQLVNNVSNWLPVDEITIFFVYRKLDVTSRQNYALTLDSDSPQSKRCTVHLNWPGIGIIWDWGNTGVGISRLTWGGWTVDTQWHVWCFTTGPRGMEIWFDGVKKASNATNTTRDSSSDAWGAGLITWMDISSLRQLKVYKKQLPTSLIPKITRNSYSNLVSANDAPFLFLVSSVTAALTEDIANESDITAGGNEIVLTLTGDTWVTAGATFDAQRQNIIDGIDSAQAEATGWDAVVKASEVVTAVVRTSDTVVTITLSAHATYDITATETITVTIPSSALVTSASPVVATPTFTIVPVTAAGGPPASSLSLMGVGI